MRKPTFLFVLIAHLLTGIIASLNGQEKEPTHVATDLTPLQLFPNIDPSEVHSLSDLEDWSPNSSVALKVLIRLPNIAPFLYRRLKNFDAQELDRTLQSRAFPELKRFQISGTLLGGQQVKLSPRVRELYQLPDYWAMDIRSSKFDATFRVMVRDIPDIWLDPKGQLGKQALGERVHFDGLLLYQFFQGDTPKPTAVFVSPTLAWYPQSSWPELGKGPALLADHLVDIAALRRSSRIRASSLSETDSEVLFQLLRASNQLNQVHPREDVSLPRLDVVKLFQRPDNRAGELFRLEGRLRRITRIEVDQEKYGVYGIREYYQLDMFVPMEGRLRLRSPDTGEMLLFENDFPVSICLVRLPEFLQGQSETGVDVELTGFFFKFWSYHSAKSRRQGEQMQTSPLLVGFDLKEKEYAPEESMDLVIGMVIGSLTLGIAVACATIFILGRNRARRLARDLPSAKIELPDHATGP